MRGVEECGALWQNVAAWHLWQCGAVWQWVRSVAVVAARAKRHFPPCGHLQTRLHTGSPALIYWRMLRNTQIDTNTGTQSEPVSKESFGVLRTQIKSTTGFVAAGAKAIFLACTTHGIPNTQVHWYKGTNSLQRIVALLHCKMVALKHHQLQKCYRCRRSMSSCYNHAEGKKYQILLRQKNIQLCRG